MRRSWIVSQEISGSQENHRRSQDPRRITGNLKIPGESPDTSGSQENHRRFQILSFLIASSVCFLTNSDPGWFLDLGNLSIYESIARRTQSKENSENLTKISSLTCHQCHSHVSLHNMSPVSEWVSEWVSVWEKQWRMTQNFNKAKILYSERNKTFTINK